jgi:hypothetical protein
VFSSLQAVRKQLLIIPVIVGGVNHPMTDLIGEFIAGCGMTLGNYMMLMVLPGIAPQHLRLNKNNTNTLFYTVCSSPSRITHVVSMKAAIIAAFLMYTTFQLFSFIRKYKQILAILPMFTYPITYQITNL